jgi:hypothetical protein
VQGGLFKGMRYARSGSAPYAVLLGTYELALAPVIEQVIARKPDLIVDVGAARQAITPWASLGAVQLSKWSRMKRMLHAGPLW